MATKLPVHLILTPWQKRVCALLMCIQCADFIKDRYGNPGKNYLCEGYRMFFEHAAPYMDFMKNEYINRRPPSNVMRHVDEIERNRDRTEYVDFSVVEQ